ncbi:MAG: hypothetical protein CME07_00215 [Gemmatimonadetes bacterium]|nr:hypothetical protein [Gemmatimonadota bacterium]
MNEGHSAFLALERIRVLMEEGLSFAEARVAASASMVFTTHTPVPDAIDLFSTEQMESVFGEWRGALGLSSEELMDLGREHPGASGAPFNMAVFALRMASHANGVSALHGKVSRGMWNFLWPGLPEEDVPIGSVTNGIHSQTWVSREMRELFDRHLGPRWCRDPEDRTIWDGVDRIPDEILWRTREVQRQRLVSVVRSRLRERLVAANATPVEVAAAEGVLDPSALTIGFARRFAPYKRADLLLADPDRLRAILTNPDRPVQFVFAGKAHPRNDAGKKLIQEIVRFSRLPEVRGRVVFVEDYDMDVAARLVQGVDVWMNTPRRPLEASGTSGMKASINGVLNMSVLDGWWDEAAGERLGWSIGNGEVYDDSTTQDSIESGAIYDLLENEIAPLFYERSRDGIPEQWIGMMKETIRGICPEFNTNRMVREYAEQYYFPVADRSARLASNGNGATRELAAWMERVASVWDAVEIREIRTGDPAGLTVGSTVGVRARVALGGLSESDLLVQIYHGAVDAQGELAGAEGVRMIMDGTLEAGEAWFSGEVPCPVTGQRGFAVRVLPRHADLPHPFLPGLIRWDSDPPRGSREAAGAITR